MTGRYCRCPNFGRFELVPLMISQAEPMPNRYSDAAAQSKEQPEPISWIRRWNSAHRHSFGSVHLGSFERHFQSDSNPN
jgi:hypothetical protein